MIRKEDIRKTIAREETIIDTKETKAKTIRTHM